MTRNRPNRRGVAIIPALVCLLLVTMLCGALLKNAGTRRRVIRQEERRIQAEWLAESALARAAARLHSDRRYKGEAWEIPAPALGGGEQGFVRITVEPVEKQPERRRVRVEADYPRGEPVRARLSKSLTLDLGPESEKPGEPS